MPKRVRERNEEESSGLHGRDARCFPREDKGLQSQGDYLNAATEKSREGDGNLVEKA